MTIILKKGQRMEKVFPKTKEYDHRCGYLTFP